MPRQALTGVLATVVLLLFGCGGTEVADQAALTPASATPANDWRDDVTAEYEYNLTAHCGIEFATLRDGQVITTAPRGDGKGNPPKGWPNYLPGVMHELADGTAVFTSDGYPEMIFKPTDRTPPICA
jgi:hypothetical protein